MGLDQRGGSPMRLKRGDNKKIDRINDLVEIVQHGNAGESNENLEILLSMFHPMILKLCSKWSKYFNDESHNIIPWNILISDAQYWFIYYTRDKYTIDGQATYNKFIQDHMDQRIRYLYEMEIRYRNKHIFPDPDKNLGNDDMDMLDKVIYNYSDKFDERDMTDDIIDREEREAITKLAHTMMEYINNRRYFSDRESFIFHQCLIEGRTHQDISEEMGISRARVSQIMTRIRNKMSDLMMEMPEWWEVF